MSDYLSANGEESDRSVSAEQGGAARDEEAACSDTLPEQAAFLRHVA